MEENKALDSSEITYTTNPNISSESSEPTPTPKSEEPPIEINQEFVKPKKNTLFKVLLGIISLLIVIIIVGAILYFSGFFEHKEEAVLQHEEQHIEQPQEVVQHAEKVEQKEEGYKFNIKDINSKKLNEQLANLTNKNLEKKENEKKTSEEVKKEELPLKNSEDELLKQKAELEKQKIEFERQKAEFEKIKDETLTQKKELTPQMEQVKQPEQIKPEDTTQKKDLTKDTNTKNEFLLFINVVKIKGVLYKKYLDKIVTINPNVKLCRDEKNRIEIYYGPFKDDNERSELLNKLIKNKFTEAYELEFTQEEFDKRCNY